MHRAGTGVAAAVHGTAAIIAVRTTTASALLAVAIAGCTSAPPAHRPGPPVSYYVSVGDSLSQGVQPDSAGTSAPTGQGYADQIYATLRRGDRGLRLVKLGCPGETTGTMIGGGFCAYPGGSQLAAAASFLRAHPGRVRLITIDIGANDPDACVTHPTLTTIASCLGKSFPDTIVNLTKIMKTLRAAAALRARIIGMSYYVPTLAQWRDGLLGQALARISEAAVAGYNRLLADVYQKYGARVADVFGAFRSADFSGRVTLPGIGAVPVNVAAICRWTWECAPAPRGPNIHANPAGYRVIAQAFLAADR